MRRKKVASHWEKLTPVQRKARVKKMIAGRAEAKAKREAEANRDFGYPPVMQQDTLPTPPEPAVPTMKVHHSDVREMKYHVGVAVNALCEYSENPDNVGLLRKAAAFVNAEIEYRKGT